LGKGKSFDEYNLVRETLLPLRHKGGQSVYLEATSSRGGQGVFAVQRGGALLGKNSGFQTLSRSKRVIFLDLLVERRPGEQKRSRPSLRAKRLLLSRKKKLLGEVKIWVMGEKRAPPHRASDPQKGGKTGKESQSGWKKSERPFPSPLRGKKRAFSPKKEVEQSRIHSKEKGHSTITKEVGGVSSHDLSEKKKILGLGSE